jgi:hypothetical protein
MNRYPGSCHCGAVHFEVELADHIVVHECNCSMCNMVGFQHVIAPASRFHLTAASDAAITCYRFNTGVAQHTFCKHCGVKPFYTPRSNPDGISVNFRCLQKAPPEVEFEPFDGHNWEQNAGHLAGLSEE